MGSFEYRDNIMTSRIWLFHPFAVIEAAMVKAVRVSEQVCRN